MTALDRRAFLRAACASCAAVGLAACAGGSEPEPAAGASPTGPAASDAIVKLADIPVGGSVAGRAPSGPKLLLARPDEATVVAFSSVCTHRGCTVEPDGKRLACPCHGSVYDAFTGKNISGPAPRPLRAFAVRISGPDVVEA
ncbi:MAG: Rieske 2Fe-2S domain-containing protein [Frankiaceae bacterium]|nr:Rieske 2Fe-2S domain-containing protein [Frankiaceae bacterium]